MRVCEIISGEYSWILKVDGKTIDFQGTDNALYFLGLYSNLGYEVYFRGIKYPNAKNILKFESN